LCSWLVHAFIEVKLTTPPGFSDRPAGQYARQFSNILLRVTAIYAEGVQLHNFAGIVLIQARGPLSLRLLLIPGILRALLAAIFIILHTRPPRRPRQRSAKTATHSRTRFVAPRLTAPTILRGVGVRTDAHPVVQVEEHSGRFGSGYQQILEFSQR